MRWTEQYLFSAHMAQHILFVLVAPALLCLAVPRELGLRPADPRSRNFPEAINVFSVRSPIAGWLAGIGAMAIWHVPALFCAAMSSRPLPALTDGKRGLAGGKIGGNYRRDVCALRGQDRRLFSTDSYR